MVTIDLGSKRTAIIGGSRGIGADIARVVGRAGSRVAWTDLNPCLEQERALAELGVETLFQTLDCTNADGTKAFIDAIAEAWGGVDHLVYSAGFTSPVSFLDLTPEEWRRIVDINLNGAFYAAHAAVRHMIKGNGGSIVLIGSAAIVAGGGGRADYVSAKAGLEGLNRAICKQFGPCGVRSNLVHPSLIETELLKERYPDPEQRNTLTAGVPLGRLGQAADIAHVTAFLLSDMASYITGQSLFVDGGRTFCK